MATRKRKQTKRTFAQAVFHNDLSQKYLYYLYDEFEKVHPEHAEYLKMMIQQLMIIQEYAKDFAIRTWGNFPENIDSWRL